MNEANATLFPEDRCETFTSPIVLSHLLAQIALQSDLRGVFDELFGPTGAEIHFRSVRKLNLSDTSSITFQEIQRLLLTEGEIAIGLRIAEQAGVNGGIVLNPNWKKQWNLTPDDEVVVLIDTEN